MTHVPLNWPPDRPEFGTPAIEKPMSVVPDNHTTNRDTSLRDMISLSIALNYFGGVGARGDGRDGTAPVTRLRKSSSPERGSSHPWRTAVDVAVAERRDLVAGKRSDG